MAEQAKPDIANKPSEKIPDPMAGRRPWIRVDAATIRPSTEKGYQREVVIHGHNLRMVISPPRIEVGGIPLENVSFEDKGTTIRGTLPSEPSGDRVVVDYGFARDEVALER